MSASVIPDADGLSSAISSLFDCCTLFYHQSLHRHYNSSLLKPYKRVANLV